MAEQAREQRRMRSGPVMPPRMSLRRTKGGLTHSAPSSSQTPALDSAENKTEPPSPTMARLELNLRSPRPLRPKLLTPNLRELEAKLLSPIKMLEQSYLERGGGDVVVSEEVLNKIRLRFSKPKPLSAKRKIVNEILDDLFKNVFKEHPKSKEPLKEWSSPQNEEEKQPLLRSPESTHHETEASENVANSDPADIEKIDINQPEESKLGEENCEKTGQDIKPVPEKKSKLDESFKTHLNDNSDENGNIRESSRSTFHLPSEFLAESEHSLPILETPKKLQMVDIKQDSSIEISAKNEMLNIDVVQIGSGKEKEFIKNLTLKTPVKNLMYSFKFSPRNKEASQDDVGMDVESFKDQYLNEVGRDKSSCDHLETNVLRSVDVNKESGIKRKLDMQDGVVKKRRKRRESKKRRLKIKIITNDKKIKRIKELKRKEKMPGIKIKLKEKIKKNKKMKIKNYKQYVLKYCTLQTSQVIAKPEVDATPMKRKYTKLDKSPDNLVQTSIHSFFKAK